MANVAKWYCYEGVRVFRLRKALKDNGHNYRSIVDPNKCNGIDLGITHAVVGHWAVLRKHIPNDEEYFNKLSQILGVDETWLRADDYKLIENELIDLIEQSYEEFFDGSQCGHEYPGMDFKEKAKNTFNLIGDECDEELDNWLLAYRTKVFPLREEEKSRAFNQKCDISLRDWNKVTLPIIEYRGEFPFEELTKIPSSGKEAIKHAHYLHDAILTIYKLRFYPEDTFTYLNHLLELLIETSDTENSKEEYQHWIDVIRNDPNLSDDNKFVLRILKGDFKD